MKLTYEQILELLPAYALGALEPDEMLAVDDYLTEHRALLDQLHRAEEAATQLVHAAPMVPLPADIKGRVLERIKADLSSEAAPVAAPTPAPDGVSPAPRPVAGQPTWLDRLKIWFAPNGWAVAAVCALLLLAAAALYARQIQHQVVETQNQIAALQDEVAELQASNAELEQLNQILDQRIQASQDYLALVADSNIEQAVNLPGTEALPEANGTLYITRQGQGLLVVNGLTPLPDDQTYQLWLIPENQDPQPAGLLAADPDVPTWYNLEGSHDPQDFAAVGISIEPAGGSEAPTGPIVLLGTKS
ncbi:MAG: anti-sigma factor [Anaerolineae bacterium]|nr:anti-sigma factor [Anaerolineae bacterium]